MSSPDQREPTPTTTYVSREYMDLRDNLHFSYDVKSALRSVETRVLDEGRFSVEPEEMFIGLLALPRTGEHGRFFDRYLEGNQAHQVDKANALLAEWSIVSPQLRQLRFSPVSDEILRTALEIGIIERRVAQPVDVLTGMICVGAGKGTGLLYELLDPESLEIGDKLQTIDFSGDLTPIQKRAAAIRLLREDGDKRAKIYDNVDKYNEQRTVIDILEHNPIIGRFVAENRAKAQTSVNNGTDQHTVYDKNGSNTHIREKYPRGIPYSLIANAVRNFRAEKGWTQDEFAKMIGYKNGWAIGKIEKGASRRLPIDTALRLADVLQVTVEDLLQ